MNLFLAAALPLGLLIALRRTAEAPGSTPPAWRRPAAWAEAVVWGLVALALTALTAGLREFTGDPLAGLLGLTLTDVVLVPGIALAAWTWRRPQGDRAELTLWLGVALGLAGLREAIAAPRSADTTDLFLVPVVRLAILFWLPTLWVRAWGPRPQGGFGALGILLIAGGALLPWMAWVRLDWLAWPLALGLVALAFWPEKPRTVAEGHETTTSEAPPTQP